MFNSKALTEKWSPVLSHEGAGTIKDNYRKAVTAVLLENTESQLREERGMINEASNTVGAIGTNALSGSGLDTKTGGLAGFDPVMISLIRRAMPNLVAYDICGVQPMSGPTGLIFAMKSHYQQNGAALVLVTKHFTTNQMQTSLVTHKDLLHSTILSLLLETVVQLMLTQVYLTMLLVVVQLLVTTRKVAGKIAREDAEVLGSGSTLFNEMSFSIEKTSVTAKTRALKAEYTLELAQDLKAIHGLDAEQELANLLSSEILAEINREVVRTVYTIAKSGAQNNVANAGVFDLDVDSNGRWSVEKFKGLMFQIERDANAIAQQTRRGKGNFIITSADVASALAMSGTLDYSSGLTGAGGPSIGEVDDTGNLLVGTMNGRIKVFVDPYSANVSNTHYYVVGYKGTSPYDCGLFYCPYVPLQMLRSIDPSTFQPKIGFQD